MYHDRLIQVESQQCGNHYQVLLKESLWKEQQLICQEIQKNDFKECVEYIANRGVFDSSEINITLELMSDERTIAAIAGFSKFAQVANVVTLKIGSKNLSTKKLVTLLKVMSGKIKSLVFDSINGYSSLYRILPKLNNWLKKEDLKLDFKHVVITRSNLWWGDFNHIKRFLGYMLVGSQTVDLSGNGKREYKDIIGVAKFIAQNFQQIQKINLANNDLFPIRIAPNELTPICSAIAELRSYSKGGMSIDLSGNNLQLGNTILPDIFTQFTPSGNFLSLAKIFPQAGSMLRNKLQTCFAEFRDILLKVSHFEVENLNLSGNYLFDILSGSVFEADKEVKEIFAECVKAFPCKVKVLDLSNNATKKPSGNCVVKLGSLFGGKGDKIKQINLSSNNLSKWIRRKEDPLSSICFIGKQKSDELTQPLEKLIENIPDSVISIDLSDNQLGSWYDDKSIAAERLQTYNSRCSTQHKFIDLLKPELLAQIREYINREFFLLEGDYSHLTIDGTYALITICQTIAAKKPNIKDINLSNNAISDVEFALLTEIFKDVDVKLNLAGNNISDGVIGLALRQEQLKKSLGKNLLLI